MFDMLTSLCHKLHSRPPPTTHPPAAALLLQSSDGAERQLIADFTTTSSCLAASQNCTALGGMSNMEGSNCCPLNGEPSASQPFFSISCTFCEQTWRQMLNMLTQATATSRGEMEQKTLSVTLHVGLTSE